MAVLNSFIGGTNFPDSITSGVFTSYGNATTGVPTGVSLLYSWKPIASQAILTNADTNPNFATSTGAYVDLNGNKLAAPFTVVNNEVPLDVCRIIQITANNPFTVFCSARDFYGEPMTFGGNSSVVDTVNQFEAPRGVSAISSIKVSGAAGLSNIQINTLDKLELPFSDINLAPVCFVNYDDSPLLCIADDADTPYLGKKMYVITSSDFDQTLSTGNVRPLFEFQNFGAETTPNPFNGSRTLVIGQTLTGFGFNIPLAGFYPNAEQEIADQELNPFLNLKNYVLGYPSYSEGWEGWKS